MYITKVILENIRCFKKLEVDFENLGESVLIAGDNGDGKTTLVRSIAMGLCDESSAAALFRELSGELVRRRQNKDAIIEVHLKNTDGEHYELRTKIESFPAFERLSQTVFEYKRGRQYERDQESFPWEKIFVCGYGAGRHTHGTGDLEEYAAVDSVYTIFRYHEPLQNPELAVHRLVEKARISAGKDPAKREKRAGKMLKRLLDILKLVLNLDDKDEVLLTSTGIEVKGHWGRCELNSLGDGYKATVTWIMDFLSWRMLSGKSLDPKKMSGIVLVDEVEQHLHPRWQLKIMQLLQEAFPKIQIIATTHSPLVVSGCKHCKVYTVRRGQCKTSDVYGWLAEDVYREVMGLDNSRPTELQNIIEEFRSLHYNSLSRKMTKEEKARIKQLEKELRKLPGTDPIVLASKLENMTKRLRKKRGN